MKENENVTDGNSVLGRPDIFISENDASRICSIMRAKQYRLRGDLHWKKRYKKFYLLLRKKAKEFLDSEIENQKYSY